MQKRYYIAYGSNLNLRQMKWRCPTARLIGTARLDGWRLLFKGSKTGSYLTIGQEKGYSVPLAVWEVQPQDEQRLDHYEGAPDFYYKKEMEIDVRGLRSGLIRRRQAFVYIMHEERPVGVPSRNYIATCVEGYRDFGFDLRILADALDYSKEAVTNEK